MTTNAKNCRCGNASVCNEVRALTVNRGRWYWSCATKTCNYFVWDNSALSFIHHPYEAYNTKPQLEIEHSRRRRFAIASRRRNARADQPTETTHVSFTIINQDEIGIRLEGKHSATIEPSISGIPNIVYNPVINQYIIPAELDAYTRAYRRIPTNLKNIEVAIDPIPHTVLETLLLTASEEELEDSQTRYLKFVEDQYHGLEDEMDREAVKRGLELNGRVMLSNHTGLNGIPVAFSLLRLYQEEFPVLLLCPKVLCLTWRARIMEYFHYSKKQVVVADHRYIREESERLIKRLKMDQEESEEDEDEEDEKVKFLIVDFEKAYFNDVTMMDHDFKIVLMDNSDSLRFRMKTRVGKIANLVRAHKRVILLSEMSYRSLPVELFVQISILQPNLFTDFETYAKRYCNARQEIFGWRHDGRSNANEFKYVMDKVVWHAPDISEVDVDLREVYRHKILTNILVKHKSAFAEDLEKLMIDDYFEEDEEHEKQSIIDNMYADTGKSKIEFINHYIRHIFESYWTQEIVIFYSTKTVVQEIEKQLKNTKAPMDYILIDKQEDMQNKMNKFKADKSTRIVLVDLNIQNLKPLHSVDLVIFTEMPLEMEDVYRIEAVFKMENNREWPISLRYLVAPGSLDDYLWKKSFGSASTLQAQ